MRDAGTVEIIAEVTLGSQPAVDHLMSRFGRRSVRLGTMSEPEFSVVKASQWDFKVTIKFRHTCHNRGNAQSDARRFIHNAMRTRPGSNFRHDIGLIRVRPWQPLVNA